MRRDPTVPHRPVFEALEPRLLLDAVADWYEPDDAAWYASAISIDGNQTHSFHTGDDVDWIRFDLDERSRVTIGTDSWDGTPEFILYGPDTAAWSVAYTDDIVLTEGSYYVELFSAWDEPVEDYDVSVWAEPWFPDAYEYDDSTWYATDIATDGWGQVHSLHTAADVDWMRFTLDEWSAVTVETDAWSATLDVDVYAPDNTVLSVDDGADVLLAPGTYYLSVSERWGDLVESYSIGVLAAPLLPDWYEYDDDPWWASTIDTDGTAQYHSLHDPYDVDWVTFTLDYWSDVTVTVDEWWWDAPDFWLYGPDDSYNEISYTDGMLLEPGDYTIEIADVWGEIHDEYTIDVWAEPYLPDVYENDDVAASASDIASWGLPQTHSFHRPGDEDWMTFTLLQAANVTVETSGIVGDTELWLYGPNSPAPLIGYNDASGSGAFSRITAYVLPAGAYYVRVTEKNNDGMMDDYVLTVNAEFISTPMGLPIELLQPVYGNYLANVVELQWADLDATYNGQVSVYIDADADATNGVGETLLGTWNEDPDGIGDFATVVIPATVTPRFDHYYLWARLDDPVGHWISPVVPVRVFDRVAASEDPLGDAAGGIVNEVHGIEVGQLGDTIYYRVRADYNPTVAGGDVRIAVANVVSGIAVISHGGVTPGPVNAGDLYGWTTFLGGTIVPGRPAAILSYASHIAGHSSAVPVARAGLAWDYELEGSIDTTVLAGYMENDITISWTMASGSDIASVTLPFAHFKLPADAYVRSIYEGLLCRMPDASASAWTAILEGAALTRAVVTEYFINSAEFEVYVASVTRLYRALLGRAPDADGLHFWVHHMHAGVPVHTVAGLIMRSPEFVAVRGDVYGGTSGADFIRWLYVNVLGRVPSEAPGSNEVWPWVQALNTGLPREVVIVAFTNSAEYVNASYPYVRAAVLGTGLLGRTPGEAELTSWVAALHAGQTWQQFITMILDADEYQETTVNEYVTERMQIGRLYEVALGHAPTYDELEYVAASGMALQNVALALLRSGEVSTLYGDVHGAYSNADYVRWCYARALGRVPSAAELASWQRALDNRWTTRENMLVQFAESPESTARTHNAVTSDLLFAAIMRRMPIRTVEDVYWTRYLDDGRTLGDMMNVLLV